MASQTSDVSNVTPITAEAIADFIREKTAAKNVAVSNLKLLSGGAIQQNLAFDAEIDDGEKVTTLNAVLRADAPSGVSLSLSREQEFILFKTTFEAGVLVPEPLWLGDGRFNVPFFIMRRIGGTAASHRIVKDMSLGGDRKILAERIGEELAKIHSIRPPQPALDFLKMPHGTAAQTLIERARQFLDQHPQPYPALEWGLNWLEDNAPSATEVALCHRDYRTGNYMVDEHGLTGILDWEFAAWSDPLEDIGWFCAKCWRFGNLNAEAGGIGSREDFYRGYERIALQHGGKPIARELVPYWEVMAHLNWAIIAIQQGQRHISGEERSLNLALTGHMVPPLEAEILNLTAPTEA